MIALRGFADAGDLLVYLGFAPRGSIFVQMVGVFHNNRCFYKIRKKYSYARFPSVNFSRHTGYPAKKGPEPMAQTLFSYSDGDYLFSAFRLMSLAAFWASFGFFETALFSWASAVFRSPSLAAITARR